MGYEWSSCHSQSLSWSSRAIIQCLQCDDQGLNSHSFSLAPDFLIFTRLAAAPLGSLAVYTVCVHQLFCSTALPDAYSVLLNRSSRQVIQIQARYNMTAGANEVESYSGSRVILSFSYCLLFLVFWVIVGFAGFHWWLAWLEDLSKVAV